MIITLQQVVGFSLIFARMVTLLLLMPGFSNKEVFSVAKVVLIFWTTLLLLFYVPLPLDFPTTPVALLLAISVELLIGAILGFVAQLLIVGIEFAGNLMDTQAGLSVASLLDPATGQTTTLLSRMMRQLVIIVFLITQGHHVILGALIQSFQALPIGTPFNMFEATAHVVKMGVLIFEIGLQISAPILLVVFLVDFGFGMLSRVAPQVNVFQLGFQLKPLISVLVVLSVIPGLVDLVAYLIERIAGNLLSTLFLMRI